MEFSKQEYWSGLPFPSPTRVMQRDLGECRLLGGLFFTSEFWFLEEVLPTNN